MVNSIVSGLTLSLHWSPAFLHISTLAGEHPGLGNLQFRQWGLYIKLLTNLLIIYQVEDSLMLFLLCPCGPFALKKFDVLEIN